MSGIKRISTLNQASCIDPAPDLWAKGPHHIRVFSHMCIVL